LVLLDKKQELRRIVCAQIVFATQPENVIRSLDILVILANVNLIATHLVGSLTSLGLLEWIE
jgi:hypothetical protein